MSFDKNDPLWIAGLVSSTEWDWWKEGVQLSKDWWKQPFSTVQVDVWKYLGLLRRLDLFERLNKENT